MNMQLTQWDQQNADFIAEIMKEPALPPLRDQRWVCGQLRHVMALLDGCEEPTREVYRAKEMLRNVLMLTEE